MPLPTLTIEALCIHSLADAADAIADADAADAIADAIDAGDVDSDGDATHVFPFLYAYHRHATKR